MCIQGHHGVPVLDSAYDATGALIATGASDKLVRVWDAANGACTHNFKVSNVAVSLETYIEP